jgi:ClpP class serine protease
MANHSLLRLTSKIYNTPHLITTDSFNVILDYLDKRNSATFEMPDEPVELPEQETPYKDGLGVLQVSGSLTYRPVYGLCGEVGTSYTSLVEQVECMVEAGVKTIVMSVDSGGGEAAHVFETANEIRQMCSDNGIQLIGYADVYACSAAYALISICDEVIINPSATVGSIGCVIALTDCSKAMEQAGLKRIFITSGANKVPFANDGSFKQDFLDDLQTQVNLLNDEFAQFVSTNIGVPAKDIKALQAKTFNAKDAVEKGLANKIMTNKQFEYYVASIHKGVMNV